MRCHRTSNKQLCTWYSQFSSTTQLVRCSTSKMCFTFHNLLKQPFGTSTARVHVQWWVVQRTTLLKLETSIYLTITPLAVSSSYRHHLAWLGLSFPFGPKTSFKKTGHTGPPFFRLMSGLHSQHLQLETTGDQHTALYLIMSFAILSASFAWCSYKATVAPCVSDPIAKTA